MYTPDTPIDPLAALRNIPQSPLPNGIFNGIGTQMPPALPSLQASLGPLETRQEELQRPIDPKQPQYKIGIGARIMGTLANFLSGMSGRGPVTYTGRGATNHRYIEDEWKRIGDLNAVNARIDRTKNLYEENRNLYDQAVQRVQQERERQEHLNSLDQSSVYFDKQAGKWMGSTFGGEKREATPPQWFQQMEVNDWFNNVRQTQPPQQNTNQSPLNSGQAGNSAIRR